MKRPHPATVLLLAMILVLGYSLVLRQRREERLRAALAPYKERAGGDLRKVMGSSSRGLAPADGTPLRAMIAEVVSSNLARGYFPNGLPILVDPEGLREAGQTLDSPIKGWPRDDPNARDRWLTLRQKLRVVLEPLGLAAEVKDGAIVITSRGRADQAGDDGGEEESP